MYPIRAVGNGPQSHDHIVIRLRGETGCIPSGGGCVCASHAVGNARGMTDREETTRQEDAGAADAGEGSAPGEAGHDPTQDPAPPGNPPTDEEAVQKGEENLGRITGR